MCGIAGIINFNGQVDEVLIGSMINKMSHRGPDGEGIFISKDKSVALGHKRLSLLELTSNGAQPMTKYGRTIVFNGEIYNFKEINQELEKLGYIFTSHSDTETILTAFEAWKIDCIHKFNGAFAFIIFDSNLQEVYVVRDRIGEKPLVYARLNNGMIIASDVKALMSCSEIKLFPDIEKVKSDLIFNFWSDKERTYFKNIYNLLPGHYMKIKNGHMETTRYWDLKLTEETLVKSEEKYLDKNIREILNLLNNAISIRLRADRQIGSMLSGGIDSSIITTLASALSNYPIKCFTLSAENHVDDDLFYANLLAREIPNLEHIRVDINESVFNLKNLDKVTRSMEEVLLDKVYLYVNENYRAAKTNSLKAVLNGQGSDEISLGYYNYYDFLKSNPKIFEYKNFINFWHDQFFLKDFIRDKSIKLTIEYNLQKNYFPYLSKDLLNSVTAFGIKTHLPSLLIQEDKLSMSESVECRTVFTDYRIIEKFMSIPSRYKVYDGREKYLIRKIAKGILPQKIIARAKLGFPDLPDNSGKLVNTIITGDDFKKSEIINTLFDKKIFSYINNMPVAKQWKLASLFRFEKVFF